MLALDRTGNDQLLAKRTRDSFLILNMLIHCRAFRLSVELQTSDKSKASHRGMIEHHTGFCQITTRRSSGYGMTTIE